MTWTYTTSGDVTLTVNPTDRWTLLSRSEARPPEMQAWTAPERGRFPGWGDARDPDLAMDWRLLAATGLPAVRRWP